MSKNKALLVALHLFAAYHAVAMVMFAWPSSQAEQAVRPAFENYRRFFGLNGSWKYFAPSPWGRKTFLIERYADGTERREDIGERHSLISPAHSRLLTIANHLDSDGNESFVKGAVAYFCAAAADGGRKPTEVAFEIHFQKGVSKDEVLKGSELWSDGTVRKEKVGPHPCDTGVAH